MERLREEVMASGAVWPEHPAAMYMRTIPLDESRLSEFTDRLLSLLQEYWENPPKEANATEQKVYFHAVVYRDAKRITHHPKAKGNKP